MSDNYFFALIITFILGVNFQNSFRKVAKHVGLVEAPGDRNNHEIGVPLSGGIAMFMAFTFTALLMNESIHNLRPLFSGLLILIVIGVLSDLHEIKRPQRLFLEILAAFIAYQWGGVQLIDLGHLLTDGKTLELRNFSLPATVLAFIGIIKTLRMLDSTDGLAGSIALICSFLLAIVALRAGDISSFQILGLVCIAIISFLFFNWRFYVNQTALAFMGASGSLFLGFIIAFYLLKLSQGESATIAPVTALWIFGFPIIDTVSIVLQRLLKGNLLSDEREQFHYLLQAAGLNQTAATFIMLLITSLFAAAGFLGEYYQIPEHIMFYAFLLSFGSYFLITFWVRR